jgi:hypothetical protein
MSLTNAELELLKANSLSVANAQNMANNITNDMTVGGIFPKANAGDLSNPDTEKFKAKWCSWWPVAKILLKVAKAFTNDKADKVIDALLEVGDNVCV